MRETRKSHHANGPFDNWKDRKPSSEWTHGAETKLEKLPLTENNDEEIDHGLQVSGTGHELDTRRKREKIRSKNGYEGIAKEVGDNEKPEWRAMTDTGEEKWRNRITIATQKTNHGIHNKKDIIAQAKQDEEKNNQMKELVKDA